MRTILWAAFVAVHLVVGVTGFVFDNQPMGDVYNVYEPWSAQALVGTGIVGITSTWVYPQLALVPMLLAHLFAWPLGYTAGWAVFVTLVDAAVFAVLVGRAVSASRRAAAWFWLAFTLLIGAVGMYRLDGLTAALGIAGCLWLRERPWLGSVLLAVATWIKVWPAAIIAAAVVAVRRRLVILGGALAVSVAVVAVVLAAGGGSRVFGFIGDQAGRGLQVEAPVSMFYLWRAALGMRDSFVFYDARLVTFQVTGPEVDPLIAVMTPVLALAVGAVAILGIVQLRRGASFVRLFPALSLSLVLAFIVCNKVGSPQYIVWLVPPLVTGILLDRARWLRPAALALGIALLTQIIYPLVYGWVIMAAPFAVAIVTLRNALLIVLFVWSIVLLVRAPTRARRAIRSAAPFTRST